MAIVSMEYDSDGPVLPGVKEASSLREAIRQTRPFDSVPVEALIALAWAHDRVSSVAEAPLRREKISRAQYNVLRILKGSPEGLQTHEVADRMIARAPNLTRLVDKLVAQGYLKREPCGKDRRVIWLRITPGGIALVERLQPLVVASVAESMGALSTKELEKMIRLLDRLGSLNRTREENP